MSDAEILTSHLGIGILIGVLYVGWLLRNLSRRMGEVTKMPAYFRAFDAGNVLILTATLSYTLQCSAALPQQPPGMLSPAVSLFTFYVPLALGVMVNVGATLIYWGWLAKLR